MKAKLLLLLSVLLCEAVIHAAPAYICFFSVKEKTDKDMIIMANTELEKLSKAQNFKVSKSSLTQAGKRAKSGKLFAGENGIALFLGSKDDREISELMLYIPEKGCINITSSSAKLGLHSKQSVLLHDAGCMEIFLNPVYMLYEIGNSDKFLNRLNKLSEDQKIENLKISDDKISYSDKHFSYEISLQDSRIISAKTFPKATGELTSKISVIYGEGKPALPEEIKLELFSGGKCRSEIVYTLDGYKEELAGNCDIFDLSDLGKSMFIDMRFKPMKFYEYSGGIPSREEVESIKSQNAPQVVGHSGSGIKAPCPYMTRVKEFFQSRK